MAGTRRGRRSLSYCPGDLRRPWYWIPPFRTDNMGTRPLCLSPRGCRILWVFAPVPPRVGDTWSLTRVFRVHERRLPVVFSRPVCKCSLCFFGIKITSSLAEFYVWHGSGPAHALVRCHVPWSRVASAPSPSPRLSCPRGPQGHLACARSVALLSHEAAGSGPKCSEGGGHGAVGERGLGLLWGSTVSPLGRHCQVVGKQV